MDRALKANVIAKSGKAVETAGDLDVLLLDKTGTITIGNRKATHFYPAKGVSQEQFIRSVVLSSYTDETPEGKSIIELAGVNLSDYKVENPRFIKFSAETRSSGIDYGDVSIRKGAYDAIKRMTEAAGNQLPDGTTEQVTAIASNGGTPLVVAQNNIVQGVIELQDIIKPGIQERFERLRKMGVN